MEPRHYRSILELGRQLLKSPTHTLFNIHETEYGGPSTRVHIVQIPQALTYKLAANACDRYDIKHR